ncbi:MAG: hypothetical protein HFJ30_08005 [Clostridia bacterium]|jgi:hypothetical protein|nr:hypothetical protein [Clostridia bacterium]
MISWYWKIASIIGGPILIAIVILAWKMIVASISPEKRNEVKDNLMRLIFGVAAIGFAPIFVKLMLLLNNSLVKLLVGTVHGSLDDLLGNSLLTNINTGNAIATAIVIAMFAYLFVKVNVKFIIRQFTLIVFTIFTPIVAVFWIINKRTIAASIWFGQIIINSFMQFIYTFLFLIYMNFLPKSGGWATTLLWAMMMLPLADVLQNTMQNLVSRMAGVNNEELSNRGIGMGVAMGYTIKSIAYQFKNENQEKVVGARKAIASVLVPQASGTAGASKSAPLQGESYESHSQNIMDDKNSVNVTGENKKNNKTEELLFNSEKVVEDNMTSGIKKAFNAGKGFMNMGMQMAEGRNFKTNQEKSINSQRMYDRNNINNTRREDIEENTNKIITINEENDDEE